MFQNVVKNTIFFFNLLTNFGKRNFPITKNFHTSIPNLLSAFYGGGLAFFAIGFSKTTSLSTVMLLMTIVLSTNSAVYNGLFSNHADLSPNYVGILMALSNCLGNLAALSAPIYISEVVTDPVSIK